MTSASQGYLQSGSKEFRGTGKCIVTLNDFKLAVCDISYLA